MKNRFKAVAVHVKDEANVYTQHVEVASLHLIARTDGVLGIVTTDEMVDLYDQRMAGKKGPARHIYDAIKLLPKYGICPLCDHRPVSTIDHHLPKRLYPTFAVSPDNLVGACADCNKSKLDFASATAEEVTLHPYFDNVLGERWLAADVVEGPIAAVVFKVQKVEAWSDVVNERIQNHFKLLDLKSLYGAQAAREISSQLHLLRKIYNSRGADGVREELMQQAETREAAQMNSWQAVLYRTLSVSDWFCRKGVCVG